MITKNSKLYISSIAIIISVILIFSYVYYHDSQSLGITAMNAKRLADDIIKNFSENATIITIQPASEMLGDGLFSTWDLLYSNDSQLSNNTFCFSIRVHSNGSYATRLNASAGDKKPFNITDWTVDSDDAYSIAKDNYAIYSFLKQHPSLDSFFLGTSTEKPIWILKWVNPGFMDNPKWAEIHIDATTGEVLYVEVDD